ncbi:MAG: pseudouridine-5'-phosphate glycosidase, partial [Planctomycetota bacterium]
VDSIEELADVCHRQWHGFKLPTAVLATVPVPEQFEVTGLEEVIAQLDRSSSDARSARTPNVLRDVMDHTEGRSLLANLALLRQNVAVASKLAVRLADTWDVDPVSTPPDRP